MRISVPLSRRCVAKLCRNVCTAPATCPMRLKNVELLRLDLGLLQAGAGVKGEFENRLKAVISEVKASPKPDHPLHRRGAHAHRRRAGRRAAATPRTCSSRRSRAASCDDRRDDVVRVQEVLREGRRARAALPARQGRGAVRGGRDRHDARPRATRTRRPTAYHPRRGRRGGGARCRTATSPVASCRTRRSTCSTPRRLACKIEPTPRDPRAVDARGANGGARARTRGAARRHAHTGDARRRSGAWPSWTKLAGLASRPQGELKVRWEHGACRGGHARRAERAGPSDGRRDGRRGRATQGRTGEARARRGDRGPEASAARARATSTPTLVAQRHRAAGPASRSARCGATTASAYSSSRNARRAGARPGPPPSQAVAEVIRIAHAGIRNPSTPGGRAALRRPERRRQDRDRDSRSPTCSTAASAS